MPERNIYPKETIELVAPDVMQMTVATHDWRWETPNFYILESDGEGVVIDSGCGTGGEFTAFLGGWEAMGKPKIKGVIISHHHYDHKSGGGEFADLVDARVIGGDEEEQEMQELRVGKSHLLIIPTPGHTNDSVSALDTSSHSLFTGDTIVAQSSSIVSDMSKYVNSLGLIKRLHPDTIFPGHGETVVDAVTHIQNYIDRTAKRERHIIRALVRRSSSFDAIAKSIYPHGVGEAEKAQVKAHLQKLLGEGYIIYDNNSYRLDISPQWLL